MTASNQPGSRKAEVEVAEDAAHCESARPGFQVVHFFCCVTPADNRADRGADNHIGDDAVLEQLAHDADMGKSTRSAAAKRQADGRAYGRRLRLRRRFRCTVAISRSRKQALKNQRRCLPSALFAESKTPASACEASNIRIAGGVL